MKEVLSHLSLRSLRFEDALQTVLSVKTYQTCVSTVQPFGKM